MPDSVQQGEDSSNLSTIISILKQKDNLELNRVRVELPEDIPKIVSDYKSGENEARYTELIGVLRDSTFVDDALVKLLQDSVKCLPLLNYELRHFVQALVILGWNQRSKRVVRLYNEFITDLIMMHSYFAEFVIGQLIKLFAVTDGVDWTDKQTNWTGTPQFQNVHMILKSIQKTVPMTDEIILSKLDSNFPDFLVSPAKHLSYLYNTLHVANYLSEHRRHILVMVIDRMTTMDVHTTMEEMMEQVEAGSPVDAYDCAMLRMFQYIDGVSRPGGGELAVANVKVVYNDLMQAFNDCILKTYQCSHVQFLLFYLCSVHRPVASSFLKALWRKVETSTESTLIRVKVVCYLASFLTRANFLPNGFLKLYLQKMSNWIHKYITQNDNRVTRGRLIDVHPVFYNVCQSMFYLIAFRSDDLVNSYKKFIFMQSLNLAKIVHCSLNPLAACDLVVLKKFAMVADEYQLVQCHLVMERNDRSYVNRATIEAFFPFRPYLLKRSRKYITPLFKKYQYKRLPMPTLQALQAGENATQDSLMQCTPHEDNDFLADRTPLIPINRPEALLYDEGACSEDDSNGGYDSGIQMHVPKKKEEPSEGLFHCTNKTPRGNKPYRCEVCRKRFRDPSMMRTHLHINHAVKPVECDVCAKKFSKKSNLDRHRRIHTAGKPNRCEICHKWLNPVDHSGMMCNLCYFLSQLIDRPGRKKS